MSDQLQQFKDSLTRTTFGTTKAAVQQPAIPKCYSDAGRREYRISGMCEECFDAMFKEDE